MAPCVTFRISHRPGVEYERVRQISIIYDKETGRLVARLVVEVKPRGHGRVTGAARILWPYLVAVSWRTEAQTLARILRDAPECIRGRTSRE